MSPLNADSSDERAGNAILASLEASVQSPVMKHSQLAPLPDDLPFHIVSTTIGQGAYAWYEYLPDLFYAQTPLCPES